MKSLATICVILVLCSSGGCFVSGGVPGLSGDGVSIATVERNDLITRVHVKALLEKNGIECVLERSLGYSVLVNRTDAAQALALLMADAKTRGYAITFQGGRSLPAARDRQWQATVLDAPYADLISAPAYSTQTELGTVLRHPRVTALKGQFPFVRRIETYAREYFGVDGRLHTGYEVKLEMVESLSGRPRAANFSFQVFEGGSPMLLLSATWTQ